MSTGLFYHALGIAGYFYQSTCFIAGVIVVVIQADHWRLRCPVCKSREILLGKAGDASGQYR
ncbi:MAG: hypothetical protein IPH22_12560 [Nitrosomonas sp.]|nr:hypothetical protein [Nitrosomonas sp.]